MKKTFLIGCAMFSLVSNAQVMSASQVPKTVKETFEKRYPGITAQWEYEEGKFDAEFTQNGKKQEVLFDRQGSSAQKIDIAEVPQMITAYMSKQYKGEKIRKVKKLINASGSISYSLVVKNKNLFFDASGNFLREEKLA